MNEIRYLVKSKHYKEEKECRVIKVYNSDLEAYKNHIKLDTNSTPPKLYVEIKKDLTNHIKNVILGSRVDDYESWNMYIMYYNLVNTTNIKLSVSNCNFR